MYAIWSNSVSVQEGFPEEETKAQGGERITGEDYEGIVEECVPG